MNLSPESLARHELIGLEIVWRPAPTPASIGLSGKVVDETRNTFLIETARGIKRIAKSNTSLIFTLPDGQRARVKASVLISQPENRISKRMQRTRWKL